MLFRHPLPILNISEHFTRMRLEKNENEPFSECVVASFTVLIGVVIGALLGTQNGRQVEIVNTFELAMDDERPTMVDHGFLLSRKEQCTCENCLTISV